MRMHTTSIIRHVRNFKGRPDLDDTIKLFSVLITLNECVYDASLVECQTSAQPMQIRELHE